MINGNSTNFDRRLAKLETPNWASRLIWPALDHPRIIVHDGEDEAKMIKEMEARGEIPPPGSLPAGQINVGSAMKTSAAHTQQSRQPMSKTDGFASSP